MITIEINNGELLYEWESVSIKQSMGQVQHSVDIKCSDHLGFSVERFNPNGGVFVEIFFNDSESFDGESIFKGYVQKYKQDASSTSHNISITAESQAIDLVQCGHKGKYFWQKTTAESVIKEVIEPFGLEVMINKPLLAIPKEGFRVAVDTKAYDVIKKIAEQNGLLVFTDTFGAITVGLDVAQFEHTMLTTGDYTKISIDHDFANIYSELIVKSQEKSRKKGEFKKEQQKQVVIKNKNLSRYRPMIAISNGKEDSQAKLAEYANRRINGDGIKVSLTVKSLYDKNGLPWGIGQRVWVREPRLWLDHELIISDLTFSISRSSGVEVQMSLKIPHSFTLDKPSETVVRRSDGLFGRLLSIFNSITV